MFTFGGFSETVAQQQIKAQNIRGLLLARGLLFMWDAHRAKVMIATTEIRLGGGTKKSIIRRDIPRSTP